MPGTVFAGRWEVLGVLGRGSSGAVYRVRDLAGGETCALKFLPPEADPGRAGEARHLAGIRHPGLATLRESVPSSPPAFVMDLVPGEDLGARAAPLGPGELAGLARQLLETLAFLHDAGILHRDVKPANVRLTPGGGAVLLDLGLAAPAGHPGSPAGTRGFLAPEILKGAPQSPSSDLFALGVTLRTAGTPAACRELAGIIPRLAAEKPAMRIASAHEALDLVRAHPRLLPVRPTVFAGPSIVGRDAERVILTGLLDALAEGRQVPRVVAVQGAPGSGRSRLLELVRHEAGFRRIPAVDASAPAIRAEPAARGPDWSPAAVASARHGPAAQAAARILDAARRQALVATLDADEPGTWRTDLLRCLVEDSDPDARLVVFVRARTGEDGLPDIRRRHRDRTRSVVLGDLPAQAFARILTGALTLRPDAEGAAEVAERIRRRGATEPGSFLDVVRSLVSGGALRIAAGRPVLAIPDSDIPAGGDVLAATTRALAQLAPEECRTLRLAGILGASLTAEGAARADVPESVLRELVRTGWLTLDRASGNERFAATGDGTRDAGILGALMSGIDEAAERDLHRGAARILEADPHAPPALRSWHALRSDPSGAMAEAAVRSADDALASGDVGGARRLLRAVASGGEPSGPGGEASLRLSRLEACLGDRRAAEAALAPLEALPRESEVRSRVRLARGEVERLLGDIPAATRALDEALAGEGLAGAPRAEALRVRAVCRLQVGRTADALADAAAAVAGTPPGTRDAAIAHGTVAQVLHRAGRTAEALEAVTTALGAAGSAGADRGTLRASLLGQRGMIRSAAGDVAGARADLDAAAAAFREAGHFVNLAATLSNLSLLAEREGRIETALAAGEEALALRSRMGDRVGLATSLANRGTFYRILGRFSEARADLEEAREGFRALGHPRGEAAALAELARARVAVGGGARARQHAAEALSIAGNGGFAPEERQARLAMAETVLAGGDAAAVAGFLPGRLFEGSGPAEASERLALLAEAAFALGREDEARRTAGDAVSTAAAAPGGVAALRAWLALARCGGIGDADGEARFTDVAGACPSAALRLEAALASIAFVHHPGPAERLAAALRAFLAPLDEEDRQIMVEHVHTRRIEDVLGRIEAAAEMPARALEALTRVSRLLSSEEPQDRLLRGILDASIDLAGARHGFIVLAEGDGFTCAAARKAGGTDIRVPAKLLSSTIIQDVLAHGRPVALGNARSDPRFGTMSSVNLLRLTSVACLPFTSEGRVRGAIYLDHPGCEGLFTPERVRVLAAFADHAALVFLRAERDSRILDLNRKLEEHLKKEVRRSKAVARELRDASAASAPERIVAESPAFRAVLEMVDRVARTDIPVLVTGETGTGKDVVAREIHARSELSGGPFISVNGAAIPAGLLEAELFGSVRGSYTGSVEDRPGLMALASGGTLFLDEIGDLEPELQKKLLRALEEGTVRPVGGRRPVPVSFRLITATNRPVEELRRGERFRTDLFYRIGAAVITVPPLRERPEDVAAYIDRFASGRGLEIEPAVRRRLLAFEWPGNFRELQNEMSRMAALAEGGRIGESLLSDRVHGAEPAAEAEEPPFDLEEVRRWTVERALRSAGGDKDEAARLLGVSRSTLYSELKRRNLNSYLRPYGRKPGSSRSRGGDAV